MAISNDKETSPATIAGEDGRTDQDTKDNTIAAEDDIANQDTKDNTIGDTNKSKPSRNQRRRAAKAAALAAISIDTPSQPDTQGLTTTISALQSLKFTEARPRIQQQWSGTGASKHFHTDSKAVKQDKAQPQALGAIPMQPRQILNNSQHKDTKITELPLRPAVDAQPKKPKEPKKAKSKSSTTDKHQYQFDRSNKTRKQAMQEAGNVRERDLLIPAINKPSPTEAYIKLTQEQSTRLSQPRRLLVVLDVNGLLGYKRKSGNFAVRPKAAEFLRYVKSQHVLMIWSSAPLVNIRKRCEPLFASANIQMPRHVWSRETWKLPPQWVNRRVELYKQLSWLWDAKDGVQDCAVDGQLWDQTNTVLIDDDGYKGMAEPSNLITVPSYLGDSDDRLDVLGKVVECLEEIRWQKNVSAYLAKNTWAFDASAPALNWDTLLTSIEVDELEEGEVVE